MAAKRHKTRTSRSVGFWLLFSLCLCVSAVNLSCGSKPTDMRTLVPADSLVYLETNDLGAALQPIVDSKPFTEVAKSKPDFSALKGVQLAVAVTGFETKEEKLTDEHSVGRVQPHFVAVADTHAWHFQAVKFAEEKLGALVAKIYDSEPSLEKPEKNGGRYLTWTAKDGRKAYAFVIDSLIYFSNDEAAIDKCLAVKRGEADSIAKTGKIKSADPATLASGYVSTEGIAQIANIIGLKFASEAAEDSEVQSAIAGSLPQILRNSITEISWTATKTDQGIEDKYLITMPPEIANVFNETVTIQPKSGSVSEMNAELVAQLPEDVSVATRYDLNSPRTAWRSVLLAGAKNLDPIQNKIFLGFAGLLFEPYGIRDAELFLASMDNQLAIKGSKWIITAKLEDQSDEPVAILAPGDFQMVKKAISPDLKAPEQIVEGGVNTFSNEDGSHQLIYDTQRIRMGSKEHLQRLDGPFTGQLSDIKSDLLRRLATSKAPVATVGKDLESASQIADMLSAKKSDDAKTESTYFTETRFTKSGMERKTVSDFGFIGSIIAQLGGDQ